MATLASSLIEEVPWLIKVELVAEPSIDARVGVSMVAIFEPCWMDLIIDFLVENRVPADEKEVDRVRRVAARYWLSADRKLYRTVRLAHWGWGWGWNYHHHPERDKVGTFF